MKRFPFRYNGFTLAVLCLLLALCGISFAMTTWQFSVFIQDGNLSSAWEWLKYILLYGVSIGLSVIVVAMLIRSEYIVTDRELILRFGFIRSRYDLGKIFSVRLFQGSNRLAVYFDDFQSQYMLIAVKPEWFDAFIRALQEKKPSISCDFTTLEEEQKK